jgi:TetR/AcrR family transcriptional regulator
MSPGKLKILKAVSTLLEDPSVKVTICRIADEVHVTEAAIYRHYRSKEEIFTSIITYMEENLLTGLEEITARQDIAALETLFTHYMDFFEGHPGLARLFLGHGATEATGISERIKLLSAKMRSHVAQFLRTNQNMLHSHMTPEQGVELFYGLVASAAMSITYGFPQIDMEDRWEVYAQSTFKASTGQVAA